METKMVKVPFNIELAKQITNGEKEGRIVTRDGEIVRILSFDRKDEYRPIIVLVDDGEMENVYALGIDGKESVRDTISKNDLMLEVPEYTQFKDGDVIAFGLSIDHPLIGIFKKDNKDTHTCYVVLNNSLQFDEIRWLYDNSRLATEAERQQLIDALKQSTDPRVKNCLKMLGIEEEKPKYEFKPFDKVLVRDSILHKWEIDFFKKEIFSEERGNEYSCLLDNWKYCIPYNEQTAYLFDTTKNIND